MNLPKDWTKKKDWLDKASEPSEGGRVFLWAAGIVGLSLLSLGLLVAGLFF